MKSAKLLVSVSFLFFLFSSQVFAGPFLLGKASVDSDWTTVVFDTSVSNAIVFTTLPVNTGSSDTISQVRNVSDSGFEVRLLNSIGGPLTASDIGFLAVQAGTHTLGGQTFTAGTTTLTTQPGTLGAVANVTYDSPFDSAPGVLTSTQTVNDPNDAFMVGRTDNISMSGFDLRLQTLDGASNSSFTSNNEIVGWLAFENNAHTFAEGNLIGQGRVNPFGVNHQSYTATFGGLGNYDTDDDGDVDADDQQPELAVFGQIGFEGSDFAWLSAAGAPTSNSISIFSDEETTIDVETIHTYEPVSLLAFEYPAPVPEPGAIWLLLAGMLGLLGRNSRV